MTDKVSICNVALQKIGGARILSLTDDSNRARGLNTLYEETVLSELSGNYWNFAMKRISLPADATAPDWQFARRFLLPGDFLTLFKIEDDPKYTIEGDYILTDDTAPLSISYIYNRPVESKFHKQFATMVSCKIALDMSEDLVQKNSLSERIEREYKTARRTAMAVDAIQQYPADLEETIWLDARN